MSRFEKKYTRSFEEVLRRRGLRAQEQMRYTGSPMPMVD